MTFGPGLRSWIAAVVLIAQTLAGQAVPPPGFVRAQPQGATPPQQQPQQQQPPPQAPASQPAPVAPGPAVASSAGGLNLQNASLAQVIDILARQLKINYILDPRVRGGVTINTYGETKAIDNRSLLDTILRINGAAMIQVGDIHRIVPLTDVQRLPGLKPEINGKPFPEDDSTMLNLLFLKYATVDELAKLLNEFLGEHGKMWSYPAANLLLIQDSRRNMRRLMDLVGLFDSDTFASQRVRLFEVKNGRPSDISKELEGILKGISLNDKSTPVKLLPVDRISTLIAVAPNPGVFNEVEVWLKKLDIAKPSTAGQVENFVYRVRFGFAPTLAMAIMGLYSDNPMIAMQMMAMMGSMGGMMGGGMMGGGMGGMMGGPYGATGVMPGMLNMGGMYGGGMGMMGGMFGGGMYGGGMYGGGMYGGGAYPGMLNAPTYGMQTASSMGAVGAATPGGPGSVPGSGIGADLTGSYLGPGGIRTQTAQRGPKIIPNPFDNTLLIQATRQEYEGIVNLLRDIDVPPRQVLIEAKIYEVSLTGALSSGVSAYLQARGKAESRDFAASLAEGAVGISAGALVGASKELLWALSTQEVASNARVVSAPSVIATDSMPATINVGQQVPTLTSQAATGVQQGGSSLFANNISNRDTGVTLNVMARVNPSGIVTLTINQEVSAPIAPDPSSAIQSPSFSKRSVNTQITLQDGDTIAIGGIIAENAGNSSTGIPVLHRLPIIGAAFGSRSYTKERTELIIFMTPRVIYDMSMMNEASDELKGRLKKMTRYLKDEDK